MAHWGPTSSGSRRTCRLPPIDHLFQIADRDPHKTPVALSCDVALLAQSSDHANHLRGKLLAGSMPHLRACSWISQQVLILAIPVFPRHSRLAMRPPHAPHATLTATSVLKITYKCQLTLTPDFQCLKYMIEQNLHDVASAIPRSPISTPASRFSSQEPSCEDLSPGDLQIQYEEPRSLKICSSLDAPSAEYKRDLLPLSSLPVPTKEGFRTHVTDLFPQIEPNIVRRFARIQNRRYERLIRLRRTRFSAMRRRSGSSGEIHTALTNQAVLPGGQITTLTDEYPGVPPPPVCSLPAIFPCPFCLRVIQMLTLSQWSEHACTDANSYFCTFPQCTEWYTIFKSEMGWYYHEQQHRILLWACPEGQCTYSSPDRGRFKRHLRKQHQIKLQRGANLSRFQLWKKDNVSECCPFCRQVYASWSDLSLHLVKHMRKLALPLLQLVLHD
ncbi:hypothetical protein N7523_005732 [Penicillium sp. IBT 18751x]|nr:hypothetical protein N7523_005732 [Penicillium sp. IBT 18751x]